MSDLQMCARNTYNTYNMKICFFVRSDEKLYYLAHMVRTLVFRCVAILADCPAVSFRFVYLHSRRWEPSISGGTFETVLQRQK